jgi:GTP-binding protein LepA
MPEVSRLASIEEPWIKATIMTPDEFLGPVLTLCTERRGEQIDPYLCWQSGNGCLPPAVE